MLKKAKIKKCYFSLVQADVTKIMPFKSNSIGAIVSAGTFTHGHVGPEIFDELLRITKPGGLFVITINSKVFAKYGFQKKLLKIKRRISIPIFIEFKVHGNNKKKELNNIKVFATIFRKKIVK